MQITEVRIKLVAAKNDKLRAFCSITIDNAFVVRDLKVIEGAKGPFVAMPSRKVMERCVRCGEKNHHRANYCNDCGQRLPVERANRAVHREGAKMHADIAHPINSSCREQIQARILEQYSEELESAKLPGYRPKELDDEIDDAREEERLAGEHLAERVHVAPAESTRRAHGEPDRAVESGNGAFPGALRFGDSLRNSTDDDSQGVAAGDDSPEPRREAARLRFGENPDAERVGHNLAARPPGFREDHDSEPEDNFGAGLFS